MLKYQLYTLDFFGGLLVLLLVLRMWMSLARYHHRPLLSPLLILTDWLVRPLARIVPTWRGLELAAIAAALLVAFCQVIIELLLRGIAFWTQPGIALTAIAARAGLHVLETAVQMSVVIIIVSVLASWLQMRSTLLEMISDFATILLMPLRHFMRPIGGLDLTPLIAIFILLLASQAIADAVATMRSFL